MDIFNGQFVTAETVDGQVYVGTARVTAADELQLLTGERGRPVTLDPADVLEVLPADETNPHLVPA